jgi:hypothetical protein
MRKYIVYVCREELLSYDEGFRILQGEQAEFLIAFEFLTIG